MSQRFITYKEITQNVTQWAKATGISSKTILKRLRKGLRGDRLFEKGTNKAENSTLCWCCKHAVPNPNKAYGCPWSMNFKPVPGWEAEATIIRPGTYEVQATLTSYCVKNCPLFLSD